MSTGQLIQRAREAAQQILEGAFSVELTIEPNTGEDPVTIQGFATRHRQVYDPDSGLPMNGKNCHCSFYEKTLNDLGYTTRNTKGDIIIKDWLVTWTDSIGERTYKIELPQPDETVGLIRCLLGDYATT